jgi:hypothetical protein
MEGNRNPKKVLCLILETVRLRSGPRNRWQDEVKEGGRLVSGVGWKEWVYNREEWKKLLRTARNCCSLHMPIEWNDVNLWHWVSQVVFSLWIFSLKFCLQFLLLPSLLCAAPISSHLWFDQYF